MEILKKILSEESGQGLVEYSLILTLVALAAVGAVVFFGSSLNGLYETIKKDVIDAL